MFIILLIKMNLIDKKNIFNNYKNTNYVILEIGCSNKRVFKNSICIDINDNNEVDVVGDIYDVIKKFSNNSIDYIYSSHCLEHLKDIDLIINEFSRVLKIEGKMEIIVPHFSNPYYYSDPTHKNFFGIYTFSYFLNDNYFSRNVPMYKASLPLKIEAVDLIFRSFRPRYFRHLYKKIFQIIFNFSIFFKELYEESFSSIISCYEIKFLIKKTHDK